MFCREIGQPSDVVDRACALAAQFFRMAPLFANSPPGTPMPQALVSHIVDVDARNFQKEVIEGSKAQPVFVCFWADQVPESADTRRILEKLADACGGKFRLARVDVAKDPTLAQHLRVQSLPSVKVIHAGQMVDELDGPQGERVVRDLVDRFTMSSGELIRQQLAELLEQRDFATAQDMLSQALAEEPNNAVFKVELADVHAQSGDVAAARAVLATIAPEAEERDRPQNRVELLEEVTTLPDEATLRKRCADVADLDALYGLSLRYAARGEYEQSFEQALLLLKTSRAYRDELGRRTLVRLFVLLPKGSELVKRYRRQMFNLLH